jgi:hypothetical protein
VGADDLALVGELRQVAADGHVAHAARAGEFLDTALTALQNKLDNPPVTSCAIGVRSC